MNETYEFVKDQILYAQRSYSLPLIHEAYGMAKMAARLNKITSAQFIGLSHIVCHDCLNNPEWFKRAGLQ